MSAILDHDALQNTLEMVGDDLEFLADLIASYRDDGRQLVNEIQASLAAGSAEAVMRAAHTLKGTSASLGAEELVALCRDVEAIARGGSLEGLEDRVAAIARSFDGSVAALEAWLVARTGTAGDG